MQTESNDEELLKFIDAQFSYMCFNHDFYMFKHEHGFSQSNVAWPRHFQQEHHINCRSILHQLLGLARAWRTLYVEGTLSCLTCRACLSASFALWIHKLLLRLNWTQTLQISVKSVKSKERGRWWAFGIWRGDLVIFTIKYTYSLNNMQESFIFYIS